MSDENEKKKKPDPKDEGHENHPRRRPRRRRAVAVGKRFHSTEAAATKLDTTVGALRQRARRRARSENGQTIARLGMGVIARKFGCTWRFYFSEEDEADAT